MGPEAGGGYTQARMTNHKMTLFLTLAAALALGARPAAAAAGSALELPDLMRTAESSALGDAAAFLRGVSAVGVNPAGVAVRRVETAAQYQALPQQTDVTLFGAAVPMGELGSTLGVSYLSLRSSNFDGRDQYGDPTGAFSDSEQLVALTAAQPLTRDGSGTGLAVGATVKYMRLSVAGYGASAAALDLGARWAMRQAPLSLGFSLLNLGRGPRLASSRDQLPRAYVLSASYDLAHTAALIANVERRDAEGRIDASMGMQYVLGGTLALRARYGASPNGESVMSLSNLTGGFGLSILDGKTLDYSFQPYAGALRQAGDLGMHRLTLTLRFGSSKPKLPDDPWAWRSGEYLIGTW